MGETDTDLHIARDYFPHAIIDINAEKKFTKKQLYALVTKWSTTLIYYIAVRKKLL